jgi:hypothetical protein
VARLELRERAGATEIELTHGPFATEARRELHGAGWTDTFARKPDISRPARAVGAPSAGRISRLHAGGKRDSAAHGRMRRGSDSRCQHPYQAGNGSEFGPGEFDCRGLLRYRAHPLMHMAEVSTRSGSAGVVDAAVTRA